METLTQTEVKNNFYDICKSEDIIEVKYYKKTVAYLIPSSEMERLKSIEESKKYSELSGSGLKIYNRIWTIIGRSDNISNSEKSQLISDWLISRRLDVFDMIETKLAEWKESGEDEPDLNSIAILVKSELIDKNLGIKK